MGFTRKSAGWRLLLCAVLAAFTTGQMQTTDLEPEFLAPLENLTVTQGRDVHFTCVVNHLGTYKVAWIKSDSKAILAIHTHLVAHNPRLSVTHNGHNTWKLHVSTVQKNDSGTYMCQINTDPMRSQDEMTALLCGLPVYKPITGMSTSLQVQSVSHHPSWVNTTVPAMKEPTNKYSAHKTIIICNEEILHCYLEGRGCSYSESLSNVG